VLIKGNPLKKFFKIIKKEIAYKGGIEHIQPNSITGWVFHDKQKLDEVQLLYGDNLIAKANIDTYRNDIASVYDFHGCSGFSISIPDEIPIMGKKLEPKVIVLNDKKNIKFEIKLLNQPKKTREIVKALLNSNFKGFVGNFNGIDKNGNLNIILEVASHIQDINIWMHSNAFEPIPIFSEDYKLNILDDDIKIINFKINIDNIPLKNKDKKIWFSYDREGIFIIPKDLSKFLEPNNQSIKLDSIINKDLDNSSKSNPNLTLLKEKDFIENIDHIPIDLRGDFLMVENCKILLDTIETKLYQRKNKSFIKKFMQIFKK